MKLSFSASSLVVMLLLTAMLLGTGTNGQAAPVTDADWASYNNGVRGWRFNASEKTLTPQSAPQMIEKWRFPPAGSTTDVGVIHGTPAVVNGYVYFGTGSYPAFYKLKPNGQVAWVFRPRQGATTVLPKGGINRIDAGAGFLASPLVTEEAVYIGSNTGVFYALDRKTGKELWKVNTRSGLSESSPGQPIQCFGHPR
jgi:outer membrane protein assembly factor BamB